MDKEKENQINQALDRINATPFQRYAVRSTLKENGLESAMALIAHFEFEFIRDESCDFEICAGFGWW
jgi:hypothetical protein